MDHFTALGKASKKMGHDHFMDVPDDKLEALKAMVKRFRAGEEIDESAAVAVNNPIHKRIKRALNFVLMKFKSRSKSLVSASGYGCIRQFFAPRWPTLTKGPRPRQGSGR
jgi:hypothetical protein